MLTPQHIQEGLSRAYVTAVAHMAGMNCANSEHDYGIDGSLIDVRVLPNGRRCESGFKIDFQLKATINMDIHESKIHFPLEAKNYNDLVEVDVGTPRILIVYFMPESQEDWLSLTKEHLILKHCAWWCSLRGLPATTNTSTRTVEIPMNQVFCVEELKSMIARVKGGQVL